MEQQTKIRKPLSSNVQLRVTPLQQSFIFLESSKRKQTPSTFLRNLINQAIKNQKTQKND